MLRFRLLLAASLIALLLMAPLSSAGRPYPVGPKAPQPRVLVTSDRARLDRHLWVKLRVRCIAPAGFECRGSLWLQALRGRIAGWPIPLAGPKQYTLGAGRERAIALRFAGYARPAPGRAGKALVNSYVAATFAESSPYKKVLLRWGRLPKRR